MLFDGVEGLARIVLMAVLAYVSVIAVVRVAGKRSLAKLNAFDLIVTVALGATLATVLLSKDVTYTEGPAAFGMLALLQWIVSRLSIAWPGFRDAVRSQPRLLLADGRYRDDALAAERLTRGEVDAAVRGAGLGRIEDVGAVVLETDGSLSVIRRADAPLTALADVRGAGGTPAG